jgi:membrane protease YdiL (CAAX protease family)
VSPSLVRCSACGVLNAMPARVCIACGTLIRQRRNDPTDAPRPEQAQPAELLFSTVADRVGWRRVRGVAHVFVGCLAVLFSGIVAIKLGADALEVDLALTVLMAVVACLALFFGWKGLAPVLGTVGSGSGFLVAIGGFWAIAGFARVYFPLVHWLGFPFVRYADIYLNAGFPIWSVYVFVSFAPAVCEEIVFRGYTMARLSDLFSPVETVVVQAILFALVHLSPVIFPSHFVFGLVLGIVRWRAGSLYPGMALHAAWNAYVVFCELAR